MSYLASSGLLDHNWAMASGYPGSIFRGALLGDRVPLGSHNGTSTTRVPLEVDFWALGSH